MKKTKHLILFIFLLFVLRSYSQSYTVYPIPQKMTMGNQTVELSPVFNVIIEDDIHTTTIDRLREVVENAGFTMSVNEAGTASSVQTNIWLGVNGSGKAADRASSVSRSVFADGSNKFDPYILEVNKNHPFGDIVILGNDKESAYYGMATLEQMFEQMEENKLTTVVFEDYAYMEYRGIVEGFYGYPYSVENRLSLLEYCKRYKMNLFVYGPKADPYHLGYWRRDYPTSLTQAEQEQGMITQDDLRTIAAKAQACNVNFVWAAHPAMQDGISFSSESAMDPGIEAIMNKFDHLYGLGVRGFGVFIDDITYTPSGNMQAYLADQVQKKLKEKYNTVSATKDEMVCPLFFVPTAYALNYGGSYSLNSLKSVDSDVVIAFTGYDCFSNIRGSSCADMAGRVGRNPVMWWNNPVNDDHDERIYMRGVTAHWTIEDSEPIPSLRGLMLNPMGQAQASKVALFGGADYAWNPARFEKVSNWEASIRSLVKDDEELRNAMRTFAIHSESGIELKETDELKPLFDTFKSSYSASGELPSVTGQLVTEMQKIYDACVLLRTMEHSGDSDHVLFYKETKYWIAKLQSMSNIILKSLTLLQSGENSQWTDFLVAKEEYAKIHTDPDFFVPALEGSGTSTEKKSYEVTPSDVNMMPFADWIIGKIADKAPVLPERSRDIVIITNVKNLNGPQISLGESSVVLGNLSGVSLKDGEYVGIYFNAIKSVSVNTLPVSMAEKFAFEYSINGKEWTVFTPDGSVMDMAYIRIHNNSGKVQEIPENEFTMSVSGTTPGTVTATTNMSVYSTYSVTNVIDGDVDTYFWKDGAQAVGDYITLDYGGTLPFFDITLTFTSNDRPTGSGVVEISGDGQSWTEVSTFTASEIEANNSVFSCNAGGKYGRYVRMRLTSVSLNNWLQVAEFSASVSGTTPVASDQDGNPISVLDDRSLMNGYKSDKAGHLIYRFTENILIQKVKIYHYTQFTTAADKPSIQVLADGEWVDKGFLDDYCTEVDVSDLDNISQLKIIWNESNIPTLYEVLPEGLPYNEEGEVVTHFVVSFEQPAHGKISVMAGDMPIDSGSSVEHDTEITISVSADENYELTAFTVNGENRMGSLHEGVYTMTVTEAVTIAAECSERIPVIAGSAIRIPQTDGNNHYRFQFDDKLCGNHTVDTQVGDERIRTFTMSVWVNPSVSNGDIMGAVQSAFYVGSGSFAVRLTNGKLGFFTRCYGNGGYGDDVTVTTDVALSIGEWAFISLVIDSENKTITLYKNGEEVASEILNREGFRLLPDETVFFVGCMDFAGDIEDVQLWNVALIPEQIKSSQAGYARIPENLLYYYKFSSSDVGLTEFQSKGAGGDCAAYLMKGTIQELSWVTYYQNTTSQVPEYVQGHNQNLYKVTYPESLTGGYLNVRNEEDDCSVVSGTELSENTVITIEPIADPGYEVGSFTVNDEDCLSDLLNNGGKYQITVTEDVNITITFTYLDGVRDEKTPISYFDRSTSVLYVPLEAKVKVYDITGSFVFEGMGTQNLVELLAGSYIAKIETDKGFCTIKFIKK